MWNDLSIRERAAIIKSAVKNGARNMTTVKQFYNGGNMFAEGGTVEPEPSSNWADVVFDYVENAKPHLNINNIVEFQPGTPKPDPVEEKVKSDKYGTAWLLENDDNLNSWNSTVNDNKVFSNYLRELGYDPALLGNITREALQNEEFRNRLDNQMMGIGKRLQLDYGTDYSQSDNAGLGRLGRNTLSIAQNLRESEVYDTSKADELIDHLISNSKGRMLNIGNNQYVDTRYLIPYNTGMNKEGNYVFDYGYNTDSNHSNKATLIYNPRTNRWSTSASTPGGDDSVLNRKVYMTYSNAKGEIKKTYWAKKRGIKLRAKSRV